MKKFIWFIVLMLMPIWALAAGIEDYYINATLEDNGDLVVEEYFKLSGSYNGFDRIIDFMNPTASTFNINASSYGGSTVHNGSGLEFLTIGSANEYFNGNFANIDIDTFKESTSASKGDYGVYQIISTTYKGKTIRIYNPSYKNRAFYLKYRLKNMAVLFNDVGEIGWNVVGNELTESIENLTITLNLPNNVNELRAWAHGPLSGYIKINSKTSVTFTVTDLDAGEAIDVRSVFDPDVIKNSTKKYNVNALDKILVYEQKMADDANAKREALESEREETARLNLNTFKSDITRSNYITARNSINILINEEVKNSLLAELEIYKEKLDKIEEEYAESTLNTLESKLNLTNYEEAMKAINVLDNETKKETLLNRLEELYVKLENKEKNNNILRWIAGLITLSFTGYVASKIYKRYIKDPDVAFTNEYFREIPDDSRPEDVSYLFNYQIIDKALSASIMDLIRKKVITQEKIDKNNYELTYNVPATPLSEVENDIINLIFDGASTITTKEMKRKARSGYTNFLSKYDIYKYDALKVSEKKSYFTSNSKVELVSGNVKVLLIILLFLCFVLNPGLLLIYIPIVVIYLIIRFIKVNQEDKARIFYPTALVIGFILSLVYAGYILMAKILFHNASIAFLINALACLIVLIWLGCSHQRTPEGALTYKKWKGLEKFLKEFGSFADKEVPEITLWEQYLVFATLFGCAKQVSKVMDIKLQEYNMNGSTLMDDMITNYYINDLISSSVHDSLVSARSAQAAASSGSSSGGGSWSSGSGGGGGFSSGGGSFGGGGGGGRF